MEAGHNMMSGLRGSILRPVLALGQSGEPLWNRKHVVNHSWKETGRDRKATFNAELETGKNWQT